jgi:hypothetical protein
MDEPASGLAFQTRPKASAPLDSYMMPPAISLEGLQGPVIDESVAAVGRPGRVSLADELRALGVPLDESLAELLAVSPVCSTPGSPAGSSNTSETSWSWNNELKKLGIV